MKSEKKISPFVLEVEKLFQNKGSSEKSYFGKGEFVRYEV